MCSAFRPYDNKLEPAKLKTYKFIREGTRTHELERHTATTKSNNNNRIRNDVVSRCVNELKIRIEFNLSPSWTSWSRIFLSIWSKRLQIWISFYIDFSSFLSLLYEHSLNRWYLSDETLLNGKKVFEFILCITLTYFHLWAVQCAMCIHSMCSNSFSIGRWSGNAIDATSNKAIYVSMLRAKHHELWKCDFTLLYNDMNWFQVQCDWKMDKINFIYCIWTDLNIVWMKSIAFDSKATIQCPNR